MRAAWGEIETALLGRSVKLVRLECSWVFEFGDQVALSVEAMWRLRDGRRVILTDCDDGQQFGLPAPIDAAAVANDLLAGGLVSSIGFDPGTGDLRISLSNDIVVEVLTNSSGYESWQLNHGSDLLAVGAGNGLR